jgi:hypothetical protein
MPKFCVITKCEDFYDGLIYLYGNQWRHYLSPPFPGKSTKEKRIKAQPFGLGEILILDDHGLEIAGLFRKPWKWGAEAEISQGRCKTEFRIFNSLDDAIECAKAVLYQEG